MTAIPWRSSRKRQSPLSVLEQLRSSFQLSQSRLGFSDLAQLVFFYSLTRDVLSVSLSLPPWIFSVTEQTKARLSQLGPESWLCAPPDLQTDHMTHKEPSIVMCSIQLTSANGALCVINPLYLREHGDDWLTHQPTSPQLFQPSTNNRRERRLSTTRPWTGAGLRTKRAISLDQESSTTSTELSSLIRAQSVTSAPCLHTPPTPTPTPTPTVTAEVVLRRPSRDFPSYPPIRPGSQESLSSTLSSPSTPGSPTGSVPPELHFGSPVPQSPYRVSWIEDGVWLPPPSTPSLLKPPSMELDSLSISSIEEEQESQVSSSSYYHPSASRLADKVKNRISAVGLAISGLVCQQKRLNNRVVELSERRGGMFAEAVKGFVETTLKGGVDPSGVTGSEFLQEVRLSLTALRETLLDSPEIQTLLDSMTDTPDWEIDSMVELSLHKVALKPVSAQLYSSLQASRCHDGSLPCLQGNQRVLEGRGVEELGGSAGAGVPDPPTLERMQHKWSSMHTAYSPSKKVQILLKVCKSIYHSMSTNASPGVVFGADDFLPCLTWVLIRSDVVTLQLDTDYMMELLDPAQLQGEGGYYLTSLYASLYYISSFRPRVAVRQLSVEAQKSLNQWHRRRTLYCNQSRKSKHRRTIRRQAQREKGGKDSETETGGKQEDKSVELSDSIQSAPSSDAAESQQQTESSTETLSPVREETGGGYETEDQSNVSTSSQRPPLKQQRALLGKEHDGQSKSSVKEEAPEGQGEQGKGGRMKGGAKEEREHSYVQRNTHPHDVLWTKQLEKH
ncbi:ras and Rab interactor 2 [Polymixia lowei]